MKNVRRVPVSGVLVLGLMGVMLPGLVLLTKQQTRLEGKAAGEPGQTENSAAGSSCVDWRDMNFKNMLVVFRQWGKGCK